MQLEIKILLMFVVILLVVLSMGTGGLSFQEAKSKADKNLLSLDSDQLSELAKTQSRFSEVAFPACTKTTGALPGEFAIVIEIKSDGYVGRSWKQGDSEFVLCLQKIMQDNFVFSPYSLPFYTSFENTDAY